MTGSASRRRYLAAVMVAPVTAVTREAGARDVMAGNARQVVRMIDAAALFGPEPPALLVFPALFLTSGRRKDSSTPKEAVAVTLPDPILDPILEACRRYDCYVASTVQELLPQFPGHVFHTTVLLGPEGIVLRSPKAQAHSAPGVTVLKDLPDEYEAAFGPGSIYPVVDTPIGRIGGMSLKESRVPETARLMERKGMEVLVHPAGDRPADPPIRNLRQGLAYSLGIYWLTASRSRDFIEGEADDWFAAPSSIFGPDGSLRAEVNGPSEGFAMTWVDLDQLAATRARQAIDTEPIGRLYQDLYPAT